jgi:hypothetical protein
LPPPPPELAENRESRWALLLLTLFFSYSGIEALRTWNDRFLRSGTTARFEHLTPSTRRLLSKTKRLWQGVCVIDGDMVADQSTDGSEESDQQEGGGDSPGCNLEDSANSNKNDTSTIPITIDSNKHDMNKMNKSNRSKSSSKSSRRSEDMSHGAKPKVSKIASKGKHDTNIFFFY